MSVFVVGLTGCRLMPTSERKARKLLKANKAKVFCRRPYTIRLLYKTGSATQDTSLGVDTGGQHIGLAVIREAPEKTTVLSKNEIILRSSMEKRSLNEAKKGFRRGRRHRKIRYRHPKWKHHTKRVWNKKPDKKDRHWRKIKTSYTSSREKGWLPKSLEEKVEQHIHWIERYLDVLPAKTKLKIEIARFDMARMQDPEIHGEMYQHGPQYDYENIKAYVLARDNYTCRVCGEKNKKLRAHHILYKSRGATDNPKHMVTVCTDCHTHEAHQPGGILYQWMMEKKKFTRGMRDMTFMNILAKRIRKAFPDAFYTYGNFTNYNRKELGLPKSHCNDAIVIASGLRKIKNLSDQQPVTVYQQVRKKKRSLHEASPRKGRKEPNVLAKRNEKNTREVTTRLGRKKDSPSFTYHLWDKVLINGQTAWIKGFTGSSAYLVDKEGNYLACSSKYRQFPLTKLQFVHHNNNWILYEEK